MSTPLLPGANGGNPQPPDKLTQADIISVVVTVALAVAVAILAAYSAQHSWLLCLAASVGALGGLVHEIAQSGGKILFFERKLDGVYMGSLAGMVLGSVAGILAVRGFLTDPQQTINYTQVSYEVFMAGLALKGVVEAAGGQALPAGQQSVTPGQSAAAEAIINQLGANRPALGGLKDAQLPAPPASVPSM